MDDDQKKSQFHGALFYSERINEILKGLNTIPIAEAENRNSRMLVSIWQKRYELINDLFKELYGKMTKDEREEHKKGRTIVKNHFNKSKIDYLCGRKTQTFFLELFDEWELELRAIAEKKGLIMPDKEKETGL